MQRLHLEHANFHQAILAKANLYWAHLEGTNFCRTDLYETNFKKAILTGANLQGVQMVRTNLVRADLKNCKVYGLSAWDLKLDQPPVKQESDRPVSPFLCGATESGRRRGPSRESGPRSIHVSHFEQSEYLADH